MSAAFPIVEVEGSVGGLLVTILVPHEDAVRLGMTEGLTSGLSIPDSPAEICDQRPGRPDGAL